MLKKLREQDEKRRKSLMANDIQSKIDQAGLEMPAQLFWIISIVLGGMAAFGAWYSGADGPPMILGFEFKSRPLTIAAAGFVGGIGLPRFVLNFLTKGRNKKLMNQFADGIDIIVRGVKSGLPLNECLRIIARESPAPLGPEFQLLTDNLQMGMTTERALQQFYKRVPLSEVNFFVIVLSIQAKAGGNLSEALGNLSIVIRSRKMMREKIKGLVSGSQGLCRYHWLSAVCCGVHGVSDHPNLHYGAVHQFRRSHRIVRRFLSLFDWHHGDAQND